MTRRLEIRQAIQQLSPQEAKQFLAAIKLQLDIVDMNPTASADLYSSLKRMYEKLLVPKDRRSIWEPNAATTKVHVVFGDSAAGSLKFALKQLGYEETNKVIRLRDRYAIGPLWQLHEEAGQLHRGGWFRDHINDEDEETDFVSEHRQLTEQIALIPNEASIVLWCGNNAHEQAGLRFAVYLLRNKPNKLFACDAGKTCERMYNTAERQIHYLHTGEIPSDKLQAVINDLKEHSPLSSEARHTLERDWLELAEQRGVLRIWDGHRIVNVEEHKFDPYLLETVEKLQARKPDGEFIPAARVIGEAIGYCNQLVGDSYFEYRLRQLIYDGVLEIKGVPRAMRHYSVRKKLK